MYYNFNLNFTKIIFVYLCINKSNTTIKHVITECRSYSGPRMFAKLPEHLSESLDHNRSTLAATFKFIIKAKPSKQTINMYNNCPNAIENKFSM